MREMPYDPPAVRLSDGRHRRAKEKGVEEVHGFEALSLQEPLEVLYVDRDVR
jgi:hypothetical protein